LGSLGGTYVPHLLVLV